MPNHCTNRITMRASKEFLAMFKEKFFTNNEFNFEAVSPYPKEYQDEDVQASLGSMLGGSPVGVFGEHGYEWRLKNWNTKWNAYDTQILEESDDYLIFEFLSAWDCPLPILFAIAEFYKDELLLFGVTYDIEGGLGCGVLDFEEGKLVEDYFSRPEYGYHAELRAKHYPKDLTTTLSSIKITLDD